MQNDQLILQRLEAITDRLDELARRQRAIDDLIEDATPIAREVLGTAIGRLDELERRGVFAFVRELGRVAGRVVEGYSADDVHQLGDAVVQILDVVRDLTRPEVLRIATDVAAAVRDAAHAKPLGAFGAVRAMRDDDVQQGVGLAIDVLRRVGRGVHAQAETARGDDPKAKLAALLGPRRARALPAPTAPTTAPPVPPPVERAIDPATWTRELGETIAREHGITLDAPRWALVDAARADFATTKSSPNIQRLTGVAGVTTKDLYQLFPKAPARTIAKIAGLPKPAGCL